MKKILAPLALLLLAVAIAAAAACGGDETGPVTPTEPPQATPEATPTPAPTPTAEPTSTPEVAAETEMDKETAMTPVAQKSVSESPAIIQKAPELTGLGQWINSEPLTIASQRGKVVLIDFWTYTCVNCIRTLPYLRSWHDKYASSGLVIVGVHTPEFDFEKEYDNVVEAVGEFGLKYPVAQDNDFSTWRAFENRYWPAKYIIGHAGNVRYTHFGEGAYQETEHIIRALLEEAGADLSTIPSEAEPAPEHDPSARTQDPSISLTRELYAGYERNLNALLSGQLPPYILQREFYDEPDVDVEYVDPGNHMNQFLYLNGLWRSTPESVVHARTTEEYEDYIALMFYATSVNVVMSPTEGSSYEVRLTVDQEPISPEQAGTDVMYDDEGNSYVVVDEARMYRLVDQPAFSGHSLKLASNSPDFTVFAFTFGAYQGGEPPS